MKIYLKQNVYDAAIERINWLFDEFPNIIVNMSGGKDSTVCYNLAMKVAEERGRLPLKVMFIDQEAEWDCVIEYVRTIMYDPRVEPYWYQMPIRLFNATSTAEPWLECWKEGGEWIREKEPVSVTENNFGTDRFKELFGAILKKTFPGQKSAYIGGVRCEESPTRMLGLTGDLTYKHVTWGKYIDKKAEQFTFYPIYDWSYTDVWKAIHDNKWSYCKLYDHMYQYGIAARDMRVSNVHHETAIKSLYFLQEVEPEMWNRLVARLAGVNTAGQIKQDLFEVTELPYMFESWQEYRDYLLEKLIPDNEAQRGFKSQFKRIDDFYIHEPIKTIVMQVCIKAILKNDWHSTTLDTFLRRPQIYCYRRWRQGHEVFNADHLIPTDEESQRTRIHQKSVRQSAG